MSLRVDFKAVMGELTLKQGENKFKIHICAANAVCAFIYKHKDEKGDEWCDLCGFFADDVHVRRCIRSKSEMFNGKIVKVKLNMWYKNNKYVLEYFTRMGHKVECYYKEPTDKTKRV